MKILAFYLPQFHEILENNKWWGKGFTDWTNVKKAKPLFKGHEQPREPLNDNYYDLSNIEVMKWQSKIAQEHGVDGFCYYHYWFNGKKLLEKPLENMLEDKEVTIPFCFSWANEPWARTWDGRDTDVLMAQSYGSEKEWKEHFDYLLQFFQDERYIKVDNKPMIVIYKTMHIPNVDKMCEYWENISKENGFDGLHIVETLNGMQSEPILKKSTAVVEFEPMYTLNHRYSFFNRIIDKVISLAKGIQSKDYDRVWKSIVDRKILSRGDKKIYLGAFVGWDNSARKGKNGLIINNSTPEKFGKYFNKQFNKMNNNESSFIFINAWNEWAEGTYLEPDKKNKIDYLKKISKVK